MKIKSFRLTTVIVVLFMFSFNSGLKAQNDPYKIPFSFSGMNLMIHAKMNGINIKLLIDNGVMWDELCFYGNNQVDSLDFVYDKDIKVEGAGQGDGVQSKTASCPDLRIGKLLFKNQKAIVMPPSQGFAAYFPGMAGQICGTLFNNYVVGFNFDTHIMNLYNPKTFVYSGKGVKLKMTRHASGSYSVPITLWGKHGPVHTDLYIDLGGIYPVSLVRNKNFQVPDTARQITLGYGASGKIIGYKSVIPEVLLGGARLKNVPAVLTDDKTGGNHTNLTIGLPLLMKFNLIFDYFHNDLYLEPNENFSKKIE